jgi:hypothetical protein
MKHYLFTLLAFLCALPLQAQEGDSTKYRTPFDSLGIKNLRIATLSKGKYQEFHDLDSIVQIGTVLLNVNSREIVGFVELDSTTPNPTAISRWISPDPLAHEFSSVSPYNFVLNAPIKLIDPDGRAPQDPNCPDCPPPTDEELAVFLATELLSVKHSLYNLGARLFGYEATFVENEDGDYQTGFVEASGDFKHEAMMYGLDALSVASFGRGRVTAGVFAKTPSKNLILNEAKRIGGEFVEVNHNMSARAAKFEKQITGATNVDFKLNGVKFDGFDGKTLLEAKGEGYAQWVKGGEFIPVFQGTNNLLNQARRQLEAAGNTPVVWHFAEDKAARAARELFSERGLNIEVKHTPLKD